MGSGDANRMLPLVAKAFADLGYRRATTAAIAKRCGVRENVLYRVWPSKKEMFLAAIEFVWHNAMSIWQKLIDKSGASGADAGRLILEYESTHHGDTKLYKVIFAGLTEANDPEIAAALRRMYLSFHEFVAAQIVAIRSDGAAKRSGRSDDSAGPISDDLAAWGLLGVSTVLNIDRELKLFGAKERAKLFMELARLLIGSQIDPAPTK